MFKLLIILLIFSSHFSSAKSKSTANDNQAGFVVYFQPLHEFQWIETQKYLSQLNRILSSNKKSNMEKLSVKKTSSKICLKKGLSPCRSFFSEPVFNRIEWNKFSLAINHYCLTEENEICKPLAKLHDQSLKAYGKLLYERKKKREKLLESPFKPKKKKKK